MVVRVEDAAEKRRIAGCILNALPEWFGLPDSTREYIEKSAALPFWADLECGAPAGFIVLKQTGPAVGEIAGGHFGGGDDLDPDDSSPFCLGEQPADSRPACAQLDGDIGLGGLICVVQLRRRIQQRCRKMPSFGIGADGLVDTGRFGWLGGPRHEMSMTLNICSGPKLMRTIVLDNCAPAGLV